MSEPYVPGKSYPVMAYANAYGLPLQLAYQFVWWKLQGSLPGAPRKYGTDDALHQFWNRIRHDVRQDMQQRPIGKNPFLAASYKGKDPADFCGMTGTREPGSVQEPGAE